MDDMTPMFEITEADRLRVFREDDEALAELARVTYARAISDGGKDSNAAGHLDLAIRARRAAMWGYDSPVRFDMVQVEEAKRPSNFEIIAAAIKRVADEAPLNSGNGQAPGAVDVLPPSDDAEPSTR